MLSQPRFSLICLLCLCLPLLSGSASEAADDRCTEAGRRAGDIVKLAYATELAAIEKLIADARTSKIDPGAVDDGGQRLDLPKLRSDVAQQEAAALDAIARATTSCLAGGAPSTSIVSIADDYAKNRLVTLIPKSLQTGARVSDHDATVDKWSSVLNEFGTTGGSNSSPMIASITKPDVFNGGFEADETSIHVPHHHAFTPNAVETISPAPPPSPPQAPAPTAAVPTSPLDAALAKLVEGHIAFNSPDQMEVGKPRLVQVILSTTLSPDALKAQLTEAGKQESDHLKVADRMSATLSGGSAFDVSPSGPQAQFVSKTQTTTWTWEVTPKNEGEQFLILTFDALLTIDGHDGTRNITTLKRVVRVDVSWPSTADGWFDLAKSWAQRVGWFWATLLLPVIYWLFPWLRRQSESGIQKP